tara:strand:- start:1860 stop:2780 length:921 start_codon:yes stop_codon:yes gene_type:complete
MSNKKTIQVNKDFLSLSNRISKKKDAKAKKTKPKSLISPNKMKKEFLKKVKNFQEKREKHLSQNYDSEKVTQTDDDINDFENEFNKSLGFLQNIIDSKTNTKPPPIQINVPKSLADSSTSTKNSTTLKLPPPPPYSCLKNSNKPTYRQWNKTLRKSNDIKNNILIEDKPTEFAQPSQRSILLEKYKKENSLLNTNPKENLDNDKDSVFIKKKIITKTYKRKLGKIGKTISILIKNKDTRRNIQIEKAKLGLTSIPEIKEFLKKRNLIKTGSFCPNDVLRCMYEQCILTGDIDNKNSENLIHNFVNS